MSIISEKQPMPFDDSGEPIAHELPMYHPEEHEGTDYSIDALYARQFHEEATRRAAAALLRLEQQNEAGPSNEQ